MYSCATVALSHGGRLTLAAPHGCLRGGYTRRPHSRCISSLLTLVPQALTLWLLVSPGQGHVPAKLSSTVSSRRTKGAPRTLQLCKPSAATTAPQHGSYDGVIPPSTLCFAALCRPWRLTSRRPSRAASAWCHHPLPAVLCCAVQAVELWRLSSHCPTGAASAWCHHAAPRCAVLRFAGRGDRLHAALPAHQHGVGAGGGAQCEAAGGPGQRGGAAVPGGAGESAVSHWVLLRRGRGEVRVFLVELVSQPLVTGCVLIT